MRAFIRQIDAVEASNFPHGDGKEALQSIRAYSDRQLARLAIGEGAEPALIDSLCEQTTLAVQRYTKTLGFILRSTNVRNPFELHFHLRKLLSQVIGPDARLLLSSEWEFVPFTYPMNLSLLPAFALVGLPASESANVLVTPLAGHEIGHSIWLFHDFKAEFEEALAVAIDSTMNSHAAETDRLVDALRLGDLGKQSIKQSCLHYGMLQLEETFCDVIGLYYFGPAYLYAFEYFLAPGGSIRSLEYPSDLNRINYMHSAAVLLGLDFEESTFESWQDSSENSSIHKDSVVLLDAAVNSAVTAVINKASEFLEAKGVTKPDPTGVSRILEAFERGEPDCDGGSLPEVVTAGWIYVRRNDGLAGDSEIDQFRTLGDLMLKSVEVTEYLNRVGASA
jgi:hypothetical protein